jgi:FkbM family methyltransferase
MQFSEIILKEIINNRRNNHEDNFDPWMKYDPRFHESKYKHSLREILLNYFIPIDGKIPDSRKIRNIFNPKKFYFSLLSSCNEINYLYDLLNDQASRDLLIKLLAYKILGYTKVKLPRNTAKYWDDIQNIKSLNVGYGNVKINFLNLDLLLLDLNPIGFNIKANATSEGVAAVFAQKQYEYHGKQTHIKAQKGDIVLDCGACWGETTLYFAHEVGEDGKVYAFEFVPANLEIFNQNINYNPHLKDRIELVLQPVWNISDEILTFSDFGPGSNVNKNDSTQEGAQTCKTISIDDFVKRQNINKIDFIKMDIEGAEINALKGAINTIKTFRPTLAISAYHKDDDLITIPKLLNDLNLDYEFYLEHHTIHFWETVLYAYPVNRHA